MRYFKLLSLIVFCIAPLLHAEICQLSLASQVVLVAKPSVGNFNFSTSCTSEQKQKALIVIERLAGTFPQKVIEEYISEEGGEGVVITPSKITFRSVTKEVEKQLQNIDSSMRVSEVALNQREKKVLFLSSTETLSYVNLPTSLGLKSITFTQQNEESGTSKTYFMFARIQKELMVVVSKTSLSPTMPLDETMFEMKMVKTETPDQFLTDLTHIERYTPMRTLPASSYIKRGDLFARELVKSGSLVTMIYEGEGVSLSQSGSAITGGRHGDRVTLKNSKNGKQISGRVIDFNKVLIEL